MTVTPGFGDGAPTSAWLVAASPTAVAAIPMTSAAPAMMRLRNPITLARGLIVVVSRIWLVLAELFITLILHPEPASQ
jgi:hypothetical protein